LEKGVLRSFLQKKLAGLALMIMLEHG